MHFVSSSHSNIVFLCVCVLWSPHRAPPSPRTGSSRKSGKRAKVDSVITEARPEGEHNIRGGDGRAAVGLDALLGPLKDSAAFGGLKKKVEKLERTNLKLEKPAGEVKQARATRKVGYEQAQLSVSKWGSVVKANREAEHLAFPLPSQHGGVVHGTSAELTAKFRPATELEHTVASILDSTAAAEVRSLHPFSWHSAGVWYLAGVCLVCERTWMSVRACVHACVREGVRVCVCVCVRACIRF
jgi:hypothetical protein